jgi:hypothetical protein
VNASSWKVADPNLKTDVPAKLGHWAGYRTAKALAWVTDIGYGQWIARCGNEVCNPTNLAEAKRQALAMAVGGIGDYQVSDPIAESQQLSAIIEDRYAAQFIVSEEPAAVAEPAAGSGGRIDHCRSVHRPAPVQGDEPQIESYEDKFPKLPDFLRRDFDE